jgi:uncharacterized membrane protein
MQRGFMIMIIGITIQIVNWAFSSTQSAKGISGYITIIGWVIFFAGLGIRQLDKKKLQSNDSKRKRN